MNIETEIIMNKEIDRTKDMIVYETKYGLYFEHNNHDNSCYVYGSNRLWDFSGSFDLHPHIAEWINKHKHYEFVEDLEHYKHKYI